MGNPKTQFRLDTAAAHVFHITDVEAEQLYAEVGAVLDDSFPFGSMGHFDGTTFTTLLVAIPSCRSAGTPDELDARVRRRQRRR